jgi:hypothetical protein
LNNHGPDNNSEGGRCIFLKKESRGTFSDMASGFALVKAVVSGDTVVLQGAYLLHVLPVLVAEHHVPIVWTLTGNLISYLRAAHLHRAGKAASPNQTAPERQLTLTNISAPRFSRSKNQVDEVPTTFRRELTLW